MVKFAQMPKYEAYKDSGVEWLGQIPTEWSVVRFRDLFKFGRGLTITKADLEDEGIPCINYGEVHSKYGFEFTPTKNHLKCVSEDYLLTNPNSLLEKGDFIFADTSEDIEGSGNFSQLITDDVVFAGYHSVICRPIGSNNYRYLAYCLESTLYRNQVRQQVKGVKVYSITQTILKNTMVWLPSLEEQKLIANFLDQKTAQIDAAIAIKEQQIELLKERKQIIIQQAVTQGLDPNVPMKDSGVEWIGQIPEHWEVKKLKYLLAEPLKYGANESGIEYQKDLPRYIRITDFSGEGKLSEDKKLSLSWGIGRNYLISDGDILLARSGATVGKSYQFKTSMSEEQAYCFAGYLIKATVNPEKILSDYLSLYLNSDCFLAWKSLIFNKATIENIGADKYSFLSVVVPSIEEQKNILEKVSKHVMLLDKSMTKHFEQIQKLKEYKTTLINSAVTGKIKITPEMLQA